MVARLPADAREFAGRVDGACRHEQRPHPAVRLGRKGGRCSGRIQRGDAVTRPPADGREVPAHVQRASVQRERVDLVVRPWIEGRIQRAAGGEARQVIPRHAVDGREAPAEKESTVSVRNGGEYGSVDVSADQPRGSGRRIDRREASRRRPDVRETATDIRDAVTRRHRVHGAVDGPGGLEGRARREPTSAGAAGAGAAAATRGAGDSTRAASGPTRPAGSAPRATSPALSPCRRAAGARGPACRSGQTGRARGPDGVDTAVSWQAGSSPRARAAPRTRRTTAAPSAADSVLPFPPPRFPRPARLRAAARRRQRAAGQQGEQRTAGTASRARRGERRSPSRG